MRIDAYLVTKDQTQKKCLISLPLSKTPSAITLQILGATDPLKFYFQWFESVFGKKRTLVHQAYISELIQAHPDKRLQMDVN